MGSSCTVHGIPKETVEDDPSTFEVPNIFQETQRFSKTKKGVLNITMLLLGPAESGKSTLFKQMKILNLDGFSARERISFIATIRRNLMVVFLTILKEMEELKIEFSETVTEDNAALFEELSDYVETQMTESQLSQMRSIIEILLRDRGVQECKSRDFEYHHLDSSNYFIERALEIMKPDFLPTNEDIVRARKVTTSLNRITLKKKNMVINLIDVGGQRSERKKWSLIFNSVDAVIFVVSLIEFDQVLEEDGVTNRFEETLKLFSQVNHHSQLRNTMMIVFMNKKDIMARKLKKVSFRNHFPDYEGNNENILEIGEFMRGKLEERGNGRQLYTHLTCATDQKNVEFVFDAVHDSIIHMSMTHIGLH